MIRSVAAVALALIATLSALGAEGDVRWKRPLHADELWPTLGDVLGLTPAELGPLPKLPPLPLVRTGDGKADAAAFAAWRAVTDHVADLVIDPRPTRPPTRRFRFTVGQHGLKAEQINGPQQEDAIEKVALAGGPHASWPAGWAVLGGATGQAAITITAPVIAESGLWRIAVRAARGSVPVAASARHRPCQLALAVDGRTLSTVVLDDAEGVFRIIEASSVLKSGAAVKLLVGEANAIADPKLPTPELLVGLIELEGPLFDEHAGWPHNAQRRLLEPDPPVPPKKIPGKAPPPPKPPPPKSLTESEQLGRLLRRAFRRPPTESETNHYSKKLASGGETLAKWTPLLRELLADPAFLYLEDHTQVQAGTPVPLTPYERMARLCYAIRGTTPDDELLDGTGSGEVVPTDLVRGQKFNLAARFVPHWLGLDDLATLPVDRTRHPEWDAAFVNALQTEARATLHRLHFERQAKIGDLLGGPAVIANSRLARFYDLIGAEDELFRPLASSPTHGRAGLITTGAVLALASGGKQAGMATRGRWIANRLFADLPPADADELSQLLACYDEIGRWIIPPTAEQPLKDVTALRAWLIKRQASFQRRLNSELLLFTIGYDLPMKDASADVIPIDRPIDKNNPIAEWTGLMRGLVYHPRVGQKW